MRPYLKNVELSSWLGGRYWDWWMFIHFLSGSLIGLILRLIGVRDTVSLAIVLVLVVLWEVFEIGKKIYEPISNRFIDIVVGLLGYAAFFYLVPTFGFVADLGILIVLFVLWAALELIGWRAWKRRI